jgi:hypothetical protein
MHNYKEISLQDTLTKMTRAKLLRSRVAHGVRLYELNY